MPTRSDRLSTNYCIPSPPKLLCYNLIFSKSLLEPIIEHIGEIPLGPMLFLLMSKCRKLVAWNPAYNIFISSKPILHYLRDKN